MRATPGSRKCRKSAYCRMAIKLNTRAASSIRPDEDGAVESNAAPIPAAAPVDVNRPGNEMAAWTRVCRIDEIPRLGARVVRSAGIDIAVFRTADDQVFALQDKCPHKGGPLSQGIVFGKKVACPLHNWAICLDNGNAIAPDTGCTRTFAVKVERGEVYLTKAT